VRELIVPSRFRGPRSSGNGGWTSGALAGLVDHDVPADHAARWPTIAVTLRLPPPLDTRMQVTDEGGATVASLEGEVVARAELVDERPVQVDRVPADEARAAEASYPGLRQHPFPTCFGCGTEREEGDGLRIFPGPVPDPADENAPTRVAATWTPHPSLFEDWHTYHDDHPRASLPVAWAALDCVGGWAGDLTDRMMVLARITARVNTLPKIGEEHVVVGEARDAEGRKTWTAATLYDADGRALALAEHLWITVDPARF
jgi:hypothetical protein